MNRIFTFIGKSIENHPFRVLFATLAVGIVMIAGARGISMATGNDTLVGSETKVYQNQTDMEATFGGDSILVLFQEEQPGAILAVDNLARMWRVENRLQYKAGIYSLMSPASLIHEMTVKQTEMITGKMGELTQGLTGMGGALTDIGNTLLEKELPDPALLEAKIQSLSSATANFDRLIQGQTTLGQGMTGISQGTAATAAGLQEMGQKLSDLGQTATGNSALQMQLGVLSENLTKSAEGLQNLSAKAALLVGGTQDTATALGIIKEKIATETHGMASSFSGGITVTELQTMAEGFTTMGGNLQNIAGALSTFQEKSAMLEPTLPKTQEEADLLLYEEGELRSAFTNVVQNEDTAMMIVKLEGGLTDVQKEDVIASLKEALTAEKFDNLSYVVSGKPVLDTALKSEMKINMMTMVLFALMIMLVVLALVFKVQWRMLSLLVITVSVIATLGFMGWISVPVTMVSMAVFPILIGLGIDYSIQFHNRYQEEGSVADTVKYLGKAVFIAVLATVLGFLSLYISPVPMIRDFGKMLTLGVIISFLGSLFLLLPILQIRKIVTVPQQKSRINPGSQLAAFPQKNRLAQGFTQGILKLRYPVILLIVLLSTLGFLMDSHIGVETDMEAFMPQDMPALTDLKTVREVMGSTDQVVLYFKGDDLSSAHSLAYLLSLGEDLQMEYPEIITDVRSLADSAMTLAGPGSHTAEDYAETAKTLPEAMARMFITEDKTQGAMLLNIKHLSTEELSAFIDSLKVTLSEHNFTGEVAGKSVLDVEMVKGLTSGRIAMTGLGLLLIFAILLLIYRNLVKALIPILPVVSIIGLSSGFMYLFGIRFTPITATLGALVLGMGTEMTIMLMERYVEERNRGVAKVEAMGIAVESIGMAILASGLTTVGGFSVLLLSDFVILKDFGIMTVVNISLAILSTFVLLPPLLYILDRFLFSRKEMAAMEKSAELQTEDRAESA